MKQSPQEARIVERMQPGVLSRDGFLGSDRRSLGEIIDTDRSALEGLGVTQERLAARMAEALKAAEAAGGAPVKVGEHLLAEHREAMGRIPSPFPGEGVFRKGEVELTDERTGVKVLMTPLSIHMVAAHGFFQGRGSRYRTEPVLLCDVFDLGQPAK